MSYRPHLLEKNGTNVTINCAQYVAMTIGFFEPELDRCGINPRDAWFKQFGTMAHNARVSMSEVGRIFSGYIFSDVNWLLHLPELSAYDFFFWGYLKSRLYTNKTQTNNELIYRGYSRAL